MSFYDIKRGDIYYIYRSGQEFGSEQSAGRPAIIISNNQCNKASNVVEVVYCTTQPKADLPTHAIIHSTPKESIALCEQISSVDKTRLGDYIGSCNEQELVELDVALVRSIGLRIEKMRDDPDEESEDYAKLRIQRDTYKQMYNDLLKQIIKK